MFSCFNSHLPVTVCIACSCVCVLQVDFQDICGKNASLFLSDFFLSAFVYLYTFVRLFFSLSPAARRCVLLLMLYCVHVRCVQSLICVALSIALPAARMRYGRCCSSSVLCAGFQAVRCSRPCLYQPRGHFITDTLRSRVLRHSSL